VSRRNRRHGTSRYARKLWARKRRECRKRLVWLAGDITSKRTSTAIFHDRYAYAWLGPALRMGVSIPRSLRYARAAMGVAGG
jgi:hypothetical protein